MKNKILFLTIVLTFSFPTFSAPKMITCTDWDVKAKARSFREQAESDFWKNNMKEYIPGRLELATFCETAEYASKFKLSVDTDDLNKEVFDLEVQEYTFCGTKIKDVERKKGRATNSVISITMSDAGDIFNIDRSTLNSGFKIKRNFSCSIEDIVIKNQI
ncbi:MAG: hypothetical protein V7690_11265 [Shewanella sp.]|uniref:hypothetical protein n=1 Tax=Shewanella sp. TaxID=50422 RepID=UPI0030028E8A